MAIGKLSMGVEWFWAFIITYSLKITMMYVLVFYLPIHYDAILLKFLISLLVALTVYVICIRWLGKPFVILTYIAGIIYYIVNISYYENFNAYFNITGYNILLSELQDVSEHGAIPITFHTLTPLFDLPLFILFIRDYSNIERLVKQFRPSKRLLVCGATLVSLMLLCGWLFLAPPVIADGAKSGYQSRMFSTVRYDLFVNNIVQIMNSRTEKERIQSINYGKLLNIETFNDDNPCIVMLQVESLDGNIIDYKYHGDYVAPYLHQLAYQNIYYPYALVYRYAGGSSDTEIAALNGIEPFEDLPTTSLKSYNYPFSLPKMIGKARYSSFGFHGNIGRFYNRNFAYRMMGFSDFFTINDMGLVEKGWGAADVDVFNFVRNKMETHQNAALYYIVTMSSHETYKNVENYFHNDRFNSIEPPMVRRYLNSISYVDKALSDFIPFVQKRYKNVYIFIYGDHTPYLAYDSSYKKSITYLDGIGMEFVPLIIISPDGKSHHEKNKAASLLDIKPTVLSLTGTNNGVFSLGNNLLSKDPPNTSIPYRGKYFSREELYQQAKRTGK